MPDNDSVDFGFMGQFTRHDQPSPYPDRFKDPQFVNRDGRKDGVDIVLNSDSGSIMLDFGRPIQTLGLSLSDAKMLLLGLIESVAVAALQIEHKGLTN